MLDHTEIQQYVHKFIFQLLILLVAVGAVGGYMLYNEAKEKGVEQGRIQGQQEALQAIRLTIAEQGEIGITFQNGTNLVLVKKPVEVIEEIQ